MWKGDRGRRRHLGVLIGCAALLAVPLGCRSGEVSRQAATDDVLIEVAQAGALLDLVETLAERGDPEFRALAKDILVLREEQLTLLRDRAEVTYGGDPQAVRAFVADSESRRADLSSRIAELRERILERVAASP